jgi:trehalose/maltose hydrolase-like predicted phosphorylase
MRAVGPSSWVAAGQTLRLPDAAPRTSHGDAGDGRRWAQTRGLRRGGITAAAATDVSRDGPLRTIDRIAAYIADPRRAPEVDRALGALQDARSCGFDGLLREQCAAMADRWRDADLSIHGDDRLTLAARYAVFHLLTSVPEAGDAAVGARGLSGDAYGGHVLWDADMYVLPVLAAIRPAAARAMLEYRVRRLPAARRNARELGFTGARFPWESGRDGTDVTPRMMRRSGQIIPILTGQHEEHITADIAWAAWEYAAWTGDWAFLDGPGRPLVVDTARYWASRIRIDGEGRGHLYGVVGPDEYHEIVDDDAFTNVMARWNLRRAAELVCRRGGRALAAEAAEWERLAAALVDGYDDASGRYEQCAGFWALEPFVITEHFPVPLMADEVLGRPRVQSTQVIKQPDVLMLHHVVPDEMVPGSLLPDLDFYGPRTAHGSSLSPAIHASVMARAGRPDDAVELFRMACELDLADTTGTTARGLHTATAGGVWQALASGFAGLRPERGALRVDPRLPSGWDSIEVTVRFHGHRVHLTIDHERIGVETEAPLTLRLPDGGLTLVPALGGSYPCAD